MKYRADIDGLRALAVIPVLLYHAGVPGFPGGFVGVDIFFVISGYLICGMIDGDLREGSFSLSNFYKRRMLRILPALFVMFLVTSALAYLYCLPVELEDYSKSLASAVGSVSNVYFAATAGYFDAPAETKPLLHTWSLGVEEQFYLVVPLLMLLAYRLAPKRAGLLFAVAAALSFAAAFAVSYRNTTFAFYLTPFRAWELALGALLSIKFIPAPATEFRKNVMRRDRACCSCLAAIFLRIVVGPAPADDVARQHRRRPRDRLQRTRGVDGGQVVVTAAGRIRRPDILFALSLALAADRVSANGRTSLGFRRRDDETGADRRIDRHRLAVVEVRRIAFRAQAKVKLPNPSCSEPRRRRWPRSSQFAVWSVVGGGAPFRFPDRVVAIGAYLAYDPSRPSAPVSAISGPAGSNSMCRPASQPDRRDRTIFWSATVTRRIFSSACLRRCRTSISCRLPPVLCRPARSAGLRG